MTVLGAMAAVYWRKMEELQKAQSRLEANTVSRADLDKKLDDLAAARQSMHEENTRRLERMEDDIKDGLARIHDRMDAALRRPAGVRTRSSDH